MPYTLIRPAAESIVNAAINSTDQGVRNVSRVHKANWLRMWCNKYYTPAEMFAAAGPNGAQLFTDADDAITLVNSRLAPGDPDYIVLMVPDGSDLYVNLGVTDIYTVTIGPDGVVSLASEPAVLNVTVTGPVGSVVTLTPVSQGATAEQSATIGVDRTVTFDAVAGDYTLSSALAGYDDAPVSVQIRRRGQSVACGLVQQQEAVNP